MLAHDQAITRKGLGREPQMFLGWPLDAIAAAFNGMTINSQRVAWLLRVIAVLLGAVDMAIGMHD